MNGYDITILDIARLKPTEEVDAARVDGLVGELAEAGAQQVPILVERDSLAILDGHHRYVAAKRLGLPRIAAIAIAYDDPRLTLASWSERPFTRADVLCAAETGRLFPKKSTRHILKPEPAPSPVPLSVLRGLG
jgi:L-serine kinase (ADP)